MKVLYFLLCNFFVLTVICESPEKDVKTDVTKRFTPQLRSRKIKTSSTFQPSTPEDQSHADSKSQDEWTTDSWARNARDAIDTEKLAPAMELSENSQEDKKSDDVTKARKPNTRVYSTISRKKKSDSKSNKTPQVTSLEKEDFKHVNQLPMGIESSMREDEKDKGEMVSERKFNKVGKSKNKDIGRPIMISGDEAYKLLIEFNSTMSELKRLEDLQKSQRINKRETGEDIAKKIADIEKRLLDAKKSLRGLGFKIPLSESEVIDEKNHKYLEQKIKLVLQKDDKKINNSNRKAKNERTLNPTKVQIKTLADVDTLTKRDENTNTEKLNKKINAVEDALTSEKVLITEDTENKTSEQIHKSAIRYFIDNINETIQTLFGQAPTNDHKPEDNYSKNNNSNNNHSSAHFNCSCNSTEELIPSSNEHKDQRNHKNNINKTHMQRAKAGLRYANNQNVPKFSLKLSKNDEIIKSRITNNKESSEGELRVTTWKHYPTSDENSFPVIIQEVTYVKKAPVQNNITTNEKKQSGILESSNENAILNRTHRETKNDSDSKKPHRIQDRLVAHLNATAPPRPVVSSARHSARSRLSAHVKKHSPLPPQVKFESLPNRFSTPQPKHTTPKDKEHGEDKRNRQNLRSSHDEHRQSSPNPKMKHRLHSDAHNKHEHDSHDPKHHGHSSRMDSHKDQSHELSHEHRQSSPNPKMKHRLHSDAHNKHEHDSHDHKHHGHNSRMDSHKDQSHELSHEHKSQSHGPHHHSYDNHDSTTTTTTEGPPQQETTNNARASGHHHTGHAHHDTKLSHAGHPPKLQGNNDHQGKRTKRFVQEAHQNDYYPEMYYNDHRPAHQGHDPVRHDGTPHLLGSAAALVHHQTGEHQVSLREGLDLKHVPRSKRECDCIDNLRRVKRFISDNKELLINVHHGKVEDPNTAQ